MIRQGFKGFKGYVIEKLNLGFKSYVIENEKLNIGFKSYVIEKLNLGFKSYIRVQGFQGLRH